MLSTDRPWLPLALLLVACAGSSTPESTTAAAGLPVSNGDRYVNAAIGFSIDKPGGWHFVPVKQARGDREKISMGSAELDEQIRTRARDPIVTIAKYEKTMDTVNPTINVIYRPLDGLAGRSAREVAEAISGQLLRAMEHMELEGEIEETTVGGRPAGYYRMRFAVQPTAATIRSARGHGSCRAARMSS